MFIIASTGRCGTQAICHGLNRYGDHLVEHEPAPRLLAEAHLKHRNLAYRTPTLEARLRFFREKSATRYGESFRAPNLLADIAAAAPDTRFLIVVREPLEYVLSAHSLRVFRKGGEWDETRIIPLELADGFDQLPLAEKIAWHWVSLNRHLLDFAESGGFFARVAVLSELETALPDWAAFLGVTIKDRSGLAGFLRQRPNASARAEPPEGFDESSLNSICETEWSRAQRLAKKGDSLGARDLL